MNFPEKPINRAEIKDEKPNFSEQLSSYLNSKEFKEKILEFEPDQRQDVFGSVIEYSILHKDNYQLEEFLQELKSLDKKIWGNASFNQNLVKIMIKSVASKLELKQPMSKEDEKIAFDYVVENFIVDGYYFHGFNGVFEESIEEHGLSPKTRNWDVEELREISALGSKHGVETILGWHSLNSEDKSFIDHHPFNTYRYATNSPEWFGQFVGESHWVNDNGKNNKTAFVRKDYAAAKENVATRCKDMKLDEQETDKLMAFFEKYWAIFASEKAKPKVALIKTTAISSIDNIKSFNNYEELEKLVEEFAIKTRSPKQPEEVLELLLSSHIMPNDQGLEKGIKPEDIQVVNLPDYNEIYQSNDVLEKPFDLSENGIPLVINKEGQKVESLQYKQLSEMAPGQAMEIYKSLQELGSGEFKDSKLRDENGELRIVWHGSPRKFEEFKTDSKGEWRWRNHGVHYSSSKEVVEEYSEKAYTALNNIRYNLAIEMAGLKYGDAVTAEHVAAADKVYNEIIQDLVEKGEQSQYFKKGYKFDHEAKKPSSIEDRELDAIVYGKNNFGTSWAFEIFNGEMPTDENAEFSEANQLWLGKNIGRYMYACVLNIERPFEEETTEVDLGFENGEKAHADNKADGTILHHSEAVRAMGGYKEETKGTYSVAIFDSRQAKVIGVEKIEGKNGKKTFYPNKALIS